MIIILTMIITVITISRVFWVAGIHFVYLIR